jgi:hypothetical protein
LLSLPQFETIHPAGRINRSDPPATKNPRRSMALLLSFR